MALTPYATLLAKPTDSDDTIRQLYHVLARACHPDLHYHEEAKDRWFDITEAYTTIKTHERREAWAVKQSSLSGSCEDCEGSGVKGTRMFKGVIKLCSACNGAGRIIDSGGKTSWPRSKRNKPK